MQDKELFNLIIPNPEQLQERISRAIEIYNYDRSKLSDDEVAKLRAYLSCDLYRYGADIHKANLDEEARALINFEKIESECYLRYFDQWKAGGISASAAETLARKSTKIDEGYIQAYTELKNSEVATNISDKILRAVYQVLNSMSYKSN